MMRWAISEGLAENDPTIGVRKRDAGRQPRTRVLDDAELATLWLALDGLYGDARADIMRLLILTGCRKEEVSEAELSELRLDAQDAHWIIPPQRTKNKKEHVVPLSPWAERIFRRAVDIAEKLSPGSIYVFPSPVTGKPFAPTSINAPINRAIRDKTLKIAPFQVRDLRRSTATGMASIGIDRLSVSKCLNHANTDRETVTGLVYDRYAYAKEKRLAFKLWAVHLDAVIYPTPSEAVKKRRSAIKIVKA